MMSTPSVTSLGRGSQGLCSLKSLGSSSTGPLSSRPLSERCLSGLLDREEEELLEDGEEDEAFDLRRLGKEGRRGRSFLGSENAGGDVDVEVGLGEGEGHKKSYSVEASILFANECEEAE